MRLLSSTHTARCSNAFEIEVGAELAVQVSQRIQIEFRRHARAIVVRALEDARILAQVDPDQHRAVRADHLAHPREQRLRLPCSKFPMRRSGEIHDALRGSGEVRGQIERLREIGAHRDDAQGGVVAGERSRCVEQMVARDVDRDVGDRCREWSSSSRVFRLVPLPNSIIAAFRPICDAISSACARMICSSVRVM